MRNFRVQYFAAALIFAVAANASAAPSAGTVIDAKPTPAFKAHSFGNINTLKFLVMGDWGTGDATQKNIAMRMNDKAAKDGASFALLLGDNFYGTGVSSVTDPQWKSKWSGMYTGKALQIPFYVTLGNHDYIQNSKAQIEYSALDKRWKMPAREFAFTEEVSSNSKVDFFALDTDPIARNLKDSIAVRVAWLESQLKASTAKWKVVVGHHTIVSNGVHGATGSMVKYIKPLLEKYHVDVYFCGHDHDIQVLQPENGVHYIVSGGGGGWRDVKWRDNTIYANTNSGFVWCAVTDNMMECQCVDKTGAVTFAYDIDK